MNFFEVRIVSQRSQGLPGRNRIMRRIVISRIVAECDAETGQATPILSCVDLSTYDFTNHRDGRRHLGFIGEKISWIMETGIKRHKQSLTDQLIAQRGWIPGRYFFIQKIGFEQRTVLNRYPTQAEVPHDHGQTRLPLNDALRTQSNDLQTCAEDSADPAMMKVDVFRQLAPYEVNAPPAERVACLGTLKGSCSHHIFSWS